MVAAQFRSRWRNIAGPHRRWLIINAVIATAVINLVVNGAIAGVSVIGADEVPPWALGGPGTLTDTIATLFLLPLITCLLCTTAVWQEVRTGRLAPLTGPDVPGSLLGRLPARRLRRSLVFGACTTVVLAPIVIIVALVFGLGDLSVGTFVIYKVVFAVALGALVTPLIALRAMTDPTASPPSTDEESQQ